MTEEVITDADWEPLLNHPNYEICRIYPYSIRRVRDKYVIKETLFKTTNYFMCSIDGLVVLKHRLIALQFIPNTNSEEYDCIDHINHIRTDNRIENLFWCSHYENMNNRSRTKYGREIIYVDELPEDVIYVDHYNHHRFRGYYFSLTEDKFYRALRNGKNREIPTYEHHGFRVVVLTNINKRQCEIRYEKFLEMYDLI